MSVSSIVLPDTRLRLLANAPPVIIVAAIATVALAWNLSVGLKWQPALLPLLMAPTICFVIAAIYSTIRPNNVIAECSLYFGLWFLVPIFGTRLTHLINTLGYPLQDQLLASWDAALGFRWIDWAEIISQHHLIRAVQEFAYSSHFWQPAVSIVIFAVWGPRGRNRELSTSMLIALVATLAISAFFPAIGPADTHGYQTGPASIVQILRSNPGDTLTYVAITWFPSFHTVMAVLFTLAHRGIWSFPIFLVLNAVMLTAVPYSGDHYLVDVIGGAVVAIGAFAVTRRALKSLDA